MTAVFLSAVLHAVWNYLLRRAGGDTIVAALAIAFEGILLVPVAAFAWHASGAPTCFCSFRQWCWRPRWRLRITRH